SAHLLPWMSRRKKSKMVPYADRRTAGLTQVKDVRVRPAAAEDYTFLATMLGEAAVWRPDKPTPTADQVLADPRYALYLAGWPRQGDYGLSCRTRRTGGRGLVSDVYRGEPRLWLRR